MKIYGRANSINVRKVLWAADEIGLTYEREDWGRGFRPLTDAAFERVSIFRAIPVVEVEGVLLRESQAIVRYLAARHGRDDLYPTDLVARARCEAWMDWGATDLYEDCRPLFHGFVVKNPAYSDPAMLARAIDAWSERMAILDHALAAGGPYVAGETFTVGDIPVGLVVNRWFSIPFERPDFPAVSAYYDRLAERPAYLRHGRNGTP